MGEDLAAVAAIMALVDPGAALIIGAIGGYLYLEGQICDAGGYLTFGDSSGFVD